MSSVYHESRAQQQAVQCLSHISGVDMAVVGVAVFAVTSLQCRQKLSQARDGDLKSALHKGSQSLCQHKCQYSLNTVIKLRQ